VRRFRRLRSQAQTSNPSSEDDPLSIPSRPHPAPMQCPVSRGISLKQDGCLVYAGGTQICTHIIVRCGVLWGAKWRRYLEQKRSGGVNPAESETPPALAQRHPFDARPPLSEPRRRRHQPGIRGPCSGPPSPGVGTASLLHVRYGSSRPVRDMEPLATGTQSRYTLRSSRPLKQEAETPVSPRLLGRHHPAC
jgi:hypothetical protein